MSLGRLASFIRERGDLVSRILLAGLQAAAIVWFSPGRGLPLDDAWIHQVVARTFAETGTLGYAPGQHGAAATSYLWAALLALNFKLVHVDPTRWALVLNGVAALATGQLLHSLLVRARPDGIASADWRTTTFVTALLASISPNLLWFVCSGMEAMPLVALSLAAIWAASDDAVSRRRAVVAGIAAGALALLRPEAAPLGGLLVLHALLRKRYRNIAPMAVPWIACVAVYVGSNVAKTGHVLPSTLAGRRWLWFEMTSGLSRGQRALDFLDAWATRLGTFTFDTSPAVVWILVALAAYGALRLVRDRRLISHDGVRLLFAWALFHAAFYGLLLPTPGHGGRYQPLTPLLFATCLPVGAAFVLRDLARLVGAAEKIGFAWFAALGLAPWIALGAPVAESLRHANALAVAHIQGTELGAGAFVDQLPEGTVASFDIGGVGWASKRRILDLGGLSDPTTAVVLEAGRISTWLEENRVRWIVLPQSYEATLPVFEDYRTRLHLAENASLRIVPIRAFETPFDKWEPSIRATWNAAPKQVVYEVEYTKLLGPREVPLTAPGVLRPIPDPARLVPARERVVAEHMLATLAAWDLPVDVRITRSRDDIANRGACTIALGWWGITVDGCASVADAEVLRTMIYEKSGRYLDIGDLGGALRAIPHVVAQARRRTDSRFHPPLAPLMPPMRGGVFVSPMSAGRAGLALFAAILAAAMAIELASRRSAGLSHLVARARLRWSAVSVTALVASVALFGCGRHDADVAGAIVRGRGAVEIAIAGGGSVDADKGSRRVPLLEAAAVGDAEIVSLLLLHGARLDVHGDGGATPLHLAARRGHLAAVTVLAAAMSAISDEAIDATAGPRRRTALHDAALAGSVESVRALLRAGSDPKIADSFGQTPLHLLGAADPPRAAAIASLLVANGADARAADARGFSALHAAAAVGNVLLVRELARPSQLETKSPAGETPLDVALRHGHDGAAEVLLEAGAVFTRDDAWPPLHEAARMDAFERAASLIALPADTRRLAHGKTALDVAVEHGSKRVAALLRERTR